jgi:hypothetical protein
MNRIRRSLNAAVNPMSTAATRWWCHSAVRHALTGHGSAASVVVWWLRQPAQKASAW